MGNVLRLVLESRLCEEGQWYSVVCRCGRAGATGGEGADPASVGRSLLAHRPFWVALTQRCPAHPTHGSFTEVVSGPFMF